jgi:predicted permease
MHLVGKIYRRLRVLFDKGSVEREMEREMRFHLELDVEENLRKGMSPEEARRAALTSFGGVERFKERARDERGGRLLDDVVQDFRYAVRALRKRPRFTAVCILTLALGSGGTTTIFSVVNGVLLKPLPYPEPEGLVAVSAVWQGQPGKDAMAPPDVADVEALSPSIESLIGYQLISLTLTGFGDAELIQAARVSGGFMETFRMAPLLGRDIRPDETGFGGKRIAVVSERFWRSRMGSATDAVGRTIHLSGVAIEVVGVARDGIDFPEGTEVWIPHNFRSPDSCGRACHTWWTVGRLLDGAGLESARAEVRAIAETLAADYPDSNTRKRFVVESLKGNATAAVRARLWLVMAGVSLLLIIACMNVASLLLTRTYARRSELALRSSLGGSRRRLAGLIFAETGLLAATGGGLGILIALYGVEVIRRASAGMLPRVDEIAVDGSVLIFCLGVIVAVTALASWSPILFLNTVTPAESLAEQGRGRSSPAMGHRVRNGLVAVQLALSVVLLSGAGLLLRSTGQLYAVDLGFNAERMLRFTLASGGSLEEVRVFFRTLEERIASVPGVDEVGAIFGAPLGTAHVTARVRVEDRGDPRPGEETLAGIRAVSPGYLEMMDIPVLTGRRLLPSDDVGELPVAVVNQTFAEVNFPGRDPIGRRVQMMTDQGYGSPVWTIVGTVGDIRSEALDEAPIAEIYVPHGHFGPSLVTVTVRAAGDPASLLPAVRDEVRSMDPNLPLRGVETTEDMMRNEVAPTRLLMFIGVIFAGIALTLSLVGLYGVLAYVGAQRTAEFGVRLALGAQRSDVLRMILWEGTLITSIGLGVGLTISLWAAQALQAFLFQVSPWDPAALLIVLGILLPSALIAMLAPAWKASRVDPLVSLRAD